MYSVYLLDDDGSSTELDCEGVDFTTIFSVANMEDISQRADTITKNVDFKGTKTNNNAFGSLFHLQRVTDESLSNKLFFNYNPSRKVKCLVYEDGMLVLQGSLIVTKILFSGDDVTYQTTITGSFIEFTKIIADLDLDTLDFTHLQHHYSWSTIRNSWEVATERYNASTSSYSTVPFQKGSGYVYPFIEYGETFKLASANTLENVPIAQFRPAIYLKEYFDAIFNQQPITGSTGLVTSTGTVGYSYEVKGSQDVLDKFNSIIIPNNEEKLTGKGKGLGNTMIKTTPDVSGFMQDGQGDGFLQHPINFQQGLDADPSKNLFSVYATYTNSGTQAVFLMNRTFTTSAYCMARMSFFNNPYNVSVKIRIQLAVRDFVASTDPKYNDATTWTVAGETTLLVPAHTILGPTIFEFFVPDHTYNVNSQLHLRLYVEGPFSNGPHNSQLTYSITDAEMKFPKDDLSPMTIFVQDGDVINPNPVLGIKQLDFMKSIIQLFNFYVYTDKFRPKHLIFQTYDEYNALQVPELLPSVALDWTNKIDYSQPGTINTNINLPQSYLFTLKQDDDFINKDYNTNFSDVYGSFTFNDAYGTADQNTVELIFSPSPLVSYLGTDRIHPAIYQADGGNKKPVKSNIRFLYYNGTKNCKPFNVLKDALVNNQDATTQLASGVDRYPQAGNYVLQPGLFTMTPTQDLYWGAPKEVYFPSHPEHFSVPNRYQTAYLGKISDMTNINVITIECQVYLDSVDIANLDLKVPVFINMGNKGYAYFRILELEYSNNQTTSKVTLQKIVI